MVDNWTNISLLQQGRCRLCHAPATSNALLCKHCFGALPHLHHACPQCALPLLPETPPGSLCGECLSDPPSFDRACAPLRYQHPVDDMVSRFKYHRALHEGKALAHLLAEHLLHQYGRYDGNDGQVELILPMPLHPARLRQRGYNQATELTRVLSHVTGTPWKSGLLRRKEEGASQREANKKARLRNVRSAFACDSTTPLTRVAIVDDVITTGATARAAAASVKKAGAEWVEIWAVARTPKPGDQ